MSLASGVYDHDVSQQPIIRYFLAPLIVALLLLAGCSSASSSDEELAVTSDSAPLTRDELINLAMILAVGVNNDGQEIVVADELLQTLVTIHIRSTAVVDFLAVQEDEDQSFDLSALRARIEEDVANLEANGEILPIEPGSVEFQALINIILADRASNPLRGERDPATGESLVGDNPFTSSFLFDPNLARNFNATRPGFLDQFNETFADFTEGVMVASGLGTWNTETFVVDPVARPPSADPADAE